MRRMVFNLFTGIGAILCLLLCSMIASAQFRAGVQGTVTDANGGVVPGAKVTLLSKETSRTTETIASDNGFYRFSSLAPGLYSLTVTSGAFKTAVIDNIAVAAETLEGINVSLEAGGVSETVTVEADVLALDTEDVNIRRVITTDEVLKLPQAGRDPFELVRLAPGVFGAGARGGDGNSSSLPNTSGPGGSNLGIFATENAQPVTANGQRVSSNNYQIDGVSVNSQTWGGAAVVTPSQESVKEVAVTSSTYSAEDGRNSGAQVRVVTQNGTNQWHGSAFWKINDPSLNAFNKFNGVPGVVSAVPTRVERNFDSYGGSFGGKIVKDKLFFFFSYEGLRDVSENTFNSLIDTATFRQGVIAARPNTVTSAILSSTGVEPRVVQTLPGTCASVGIFIPCQTVNGGFDIGSITGAYGTYVPLGENSGGGFDGIADLQFAQLLAPSRFTGNQYFTRIDYNVTDEDKLSFSTFIVPSKALTSDRDAQSRPQADINSERLSYAFGVVYTKNISSTLVNEARFNITRWGFDETESNPDTDFGLPRIEIEGIFGNRIRYGAPRSLNTPGVINEKQFDFRNTLTKVWGNQVLKFGGEYRIDLNSNGEIGGARPLYSFVRPWNFANGTPIFEAISADQNGTPAPNNTAFKTSELAFFVQDDWKFLPNLTLNLGLRWSYYSPITARDGVLGNLIPTADGGLAGAVISTDEQLYEPDYNNFSPQVGLAWSPELFNNKLVFRTGFGLGYDRLPNALLANARRNPPNGALFNICCGTAVGDFGTPFANGQITFVRSGDGTITGYPGNPILGGGTNPANGLPNNGAVEIYGTPRELPTGYIYRYSFEGQYELPFNMVASLGYQGSAGRHFVRILPLHITSSSVNPNVGAAFFASPDVNSNFNGMNARLQGRLLRQFNFDINYRYSKSIDTTSFEGPTGATNQSFPVDQREERGPSDFDVRHNISASGLWEIPSFFNRNSWQHKVVGGWQINSIVSYHTGFPWTPKLFGCLIGTTINNFCDPRPTQYFGGRPLSNTNENFLQPGGIFPGGGGDYFSTDIPFNGNPFQNRPGIGRNSFRGPRYFSLDMTFAKEFGLPNAGFFGENSKIDVRFNFFNILNTLNLAPFNSNTDPTRVQLTSFGTATGALSGRVGEFQVRFSF